MTDPEGTQSAPAGGPAIDGDVATVALVATGSRHSIDVARARAIEIDRALAELRARFREAPPVPDQSPLAGASGRFQATSEGPGRAGVVADPDPAVVLRRLLLDGHEAACRGHDADAAVIFEEVVRVAPGRVEGHLNLGRTLLRMRRFEDSRAAFERALDLQPENVSAKAGLADCDWRRQLPAVEDLSPGPAGPRRFSLRAGIRAQLGVRRLPRSREHHA